MQTAAILMDSLRMMLARRLFWITLAISALVVLAYGSIGSNEEGLSILFGVWTIEVPMFANDSPQYKALLAGIFTNFVVPIWLTWAATILALVSTTSVFPDFQTAGSIDLVLSKPISRVKVLLVKYLGSLLFVALQVGIFCVGVFAIVGLRLGDWNWTILAAIPIVLVFYSYLYSFNVLVGILSRSTIAALLFTMVFWFALFLVQTTEGVLNQNKIQSELQVERLSRQIERREERLERAESPESIGDAVRTSILNKERARERLEDVREELDDAETTLETWNTWHERSRLLLAVLPKTQQTVGLLDRWVRQDYEYSMTDLMFAGAESSMERAEERQREQNGEAPGGEPESDDDGGETSPAPDEDQPERAEDPQDGGPEVQIGRDADRRADLEQQREMTERAQESYDEQSPWYIIGTSLGFETVVLALACFIFVRRDY